MKISSHVYINKEGVPCAPTTSIPNIEDFVTNHHPLSKTHQNRVLLFNEQISVVKQCAIPIREEDRHYILDSRVNAKPGLKPDTFYPVEPYEFEVDNCTEPDIEDGICYHCKNGCTKQAATIIRPSEPKADPKEKESYWHGEHKFEQL